MAQLARLPSQIGAIVRRRRRETGLTQGVLAERLGVRQATVSSVEAGAGGTRLDTLLAVVAALDLEFQLVPRSGGDGPAIEDIF